VHARLTLAACLVAAAARPLAAQCGMPMEVSPRRELRVSAADLAARLAEPNLVVLHVSMARSEYDRGHVPGARWTDAHAWVPDRDALVWEVPPIAQLDTLIETLGIGDDSRVVLYGDVGHLGRVFLALEVAGLAGRVAVLDGGLAAWREADQRVETAAAPARRGRFTPRSRADLVVDAGWLRERLGDRRVTIVDARSAAEYAGTAREDLPRTGHIPGARLLDWTRSFRSPRATRDGDGDPGDGRLADEATLRRLFQDLGAEAGRPVVIYCTIGMRAAHLFYVARYLGYDARLYDGSMQDWSRRADHPITRGERP